MNLCFFGDNLFGKLSLRSENENRRWGWASGNLEWFGGGDVKDVWGMKRVFFRCPKYIIIYNII
ncbi:MAG: hypothetical protein PHF18_03925 [Methanosarcina sp.]|uniref:hypothetical protein n=1 Tax=Methanosarcina sp. TaxID=2213 RepID=UPI00261C01F4|nr:hypothetical protein [Methanosarcina sp.]MDD3245997.1 hypothetical protein [Methanosarcina sp.]MDD4250121.1 hypothetical protein [Methanosarcina sp.]